MAAEDLYDFESVIPRAVKEVFTSSGFTALTIEDDPAFQKLRPRVEIVFNVHGEASPKRLAKLPDGTLRTSCFRGELKLMAITDADTAGKVVHSKYRGQVRSVIAGLQDAVNGGSLLNHKLQFIVSGQEQTGIRTQDGYQQTTFPYTVDVSIQQTAWDLLT